MQEKIEKLWKQVKKTGFPLEMKIIDSLLKRGWTVYSSSTYFDEDEDRKPRELDVKAIKNYVFGRMNSFSNIQYSLFVNLLIQCKQRENGGWIFFPVISRRDYPQLQYTDFLRTIKQHTLFLADSKRNRNHMRFLGLTRELLNEPPLTSAKTARSLGWLSEEIPYNMWDIETITNLTPSQTGASLILGKTGTNQDLFEAAMTSTKPSVQHKELQTYIDYSILTSVLDKIRFGGPEFSSLLSISFFIPMIVFDGIICFWKGEKEIPEETERVGYQFMNRSRNYYGEYYIPVVSSIAFDSFMEGLETDFKELAEKMSKKKDYIDNQIQQVIENMP